MRLDMDKVSEIPKTVTQNSDAVNLVSDMANQASNEEVKGPSVITVNLAAPASDQSQIASVDSESGLKRREVLSRRPSYRRILNDLSSTDAVKKPIIEEMKIKMANEELNTGTEDIKGPASIPTFIGNGQLFDCPDNANSPSAGLPPEIISNSVTLGDTMAACQMGQNIVTIPELPSLRSSGIMASDPQVSLAEDGSQQQAMWIPSHGVVVQTIGVDGGNMQTFQLQDPSQRIGGIITTPRNVPQMTIHSPQQMAQDASRKREMRLMKNRDAAKECRRRKKEYVKCLETRVAVLEQQNKQLIEELKVLKERYVLK